MELDKNRTLLHTFSVMTIGRKLMETSKARPSLTSAMEDYLEAIYHLEKERRIARVRDIANRLGVKMSSVSSALKTLSSRGLISYDPHQYITLTNRGIDEAREIVRKHEILKRFLFRVLKVKEPVAEDNACRIEHHLDPEVIDKLIGFLEFVEMCPVDQTRWLDGRSESCDDCVPCLDAAKRKVRTRARAQKAALDGGMTMAEATPGSQVIVDSVKGTAKFRKGLSQEGIEGGAIVRIHAREADSGTLDLRVKGYHVSINEADAAKIRVKPV
jgi:DtxR family transcriptional regulator, Mn-dependent transcriptional regulator